MTYMVYNHTIILSSVCKTLPLKTNSFTPTPGGRGEKLSHSDLVSKSHMFISHSEKRLNVNALPFTAPSGAAFVGQIMLR